MTSGFLLVETLPGKEGDVLQHLGELPEVTSRSMLFRSAVACRMEGSGDALAALLPRVRSLEGVLAARWYRARAS